MPTSFIIHHTTVFIIGSINLLSYSDVDITINGNGVSRFRIGSDIGSGAWCMPLFLIVKKGDIVTFSGGVTSDFCVIYPFT